MFSIRNSGSEPGVWAIGNRRSVASDGFPTAEKIAPRLNGARLQPSRITNNEAPRPIGRGATLRSNLSCRRNLEAPSVLVFQQGIRFLAERAGVTLRFRIEGQPWADDVLRTVFGYADAIAHHRVQFHEVLVG